MRLPADAERAIGLARTLADGRDDVLGVGLGPGGVVGRPAVHVVTTVPRDGAHRASVPDEIGGFEVVRSAVPRRPRPLLIPDDLPGETWYPASDDVDRQPRRLLTGGITVTSTDNRGAGSLGFFLTSDVTGKAYGTSNMHVLAPGNEGNGAVPYRPIEVHHPETNLFWFEPDTRIGNLIATADGWNDVDVGPQPTPITYERKLDLAVFELRSGVRWLPAVEGLGGITGVADDITFDRICLGPPYPVATMGALSLHPTGGHIHCMSFYYTHDTGLPPPPAGKPNDEMVHRGTQLVIRSNPQDDGSPGFFAQPGDSGSPILNTSHELVGIVRAGIGYLWTYDPQRTWDIDGDAPDIVDSFAESIDDIMEVLGALAPTAGLDLQVALAEAETTSDITPRVQP